jgi:hypothetical protein
VYKLMWLPPSLQDCNQRSVSLLSGNSNSGLLFLIFFLRFVLTSAVEVQSLDDGVTKLEGFRFVPGFVVEMP